MVLRQPSAILNNLKLATFLTDFKTHCGNTDVRILAHSLGARLVTETIRKLESVSEWKSHGFKIKSVSFVGAAVENEMIAHGNAFGTAFENNVEKFYNYYSPEDDVLGGPFRLAQFDNALGQTGVEAGVTPPFNYVGTDVQSELPGFCDADGDGSCDYPYGAPFFATADTGDNHFGYFGFRSSTNRSTLRDDGAMNVVVADWDRDTLPVINVPQSLVVVESTGPAGAVVTFTVTASDNIGGPYSATCNPASGSMFPLGRTEVRCTAEEDVTTIVPKIAVCTVTITASGFQPHLTFVIGSKVCTGDFDESQVSCVIGTSIYQQLPELDCHVTNPSIITYGIPCLAGAGTLPIITMAGNYTVTCGGHISTHNTVSDMFTVIVGKPHLNRIPDVNANEEALISFTAAATDSDPGQTLTFSLTNAPNGATINPSSGLFAWTPTEADGPGTYTFQVQVKDSMTVSDSQTITVKVNEVNRAPHLDPISDKSIQAGAELSFTATATDPDLPAQTLTFSIEPASTGAFPAGASMTANGVFTWTPPTSQSPGTYSVTIIVSDGTTRDSKTITINVTSSSTPAVSFLTPPVIGILAAAVTSIILGALVYFRKRTGTKDPVAASASQGPSATSMKP